MIDLQELELIKRLKYKYFRALDTNNWDLLRTCLSEDCTARYDSGKYSFDGREAIMEFLSTSMSPADMITLHQAHHPEIEISDDTHATGIWYLQDQVISTEHNFTLRGAGFYHDEYIKIDGEWKISATGYERTYEEVETRTENVQVTNNMFTRS